MIRQIVGVPEFWREPGKRVLTRENALRREMGVKNGHFRGYQLADHVRKNRVKRRSPESDQIDAKLRDPARFVL